MRLDAWNVVLAAGAGRRLSPLTGGIPKQYWRPQGRMSLLEGTLERLNPLIPARRTITIVDQSHRAYVSAVTNSERLGDIVYQPEDRGTAAGVLLGLLTVRAHAGDAIVVLTPSDHGVKRPEALREGLRHAIQAVRSSHSRIVLFGASPDSAEREYGWITPNRPAQSHELVSVASFIEKPSDEEAQRLFATGAIWNTMVLVARLGALIDLYKRHLPGLYSVLAPVHTLAGAELSQYLSAVYATLPSYDFSHDLMSIADNLAVSVWPRSVGWSDLGTPARFEAWDRAVALVPAHATPSAA